jgi:hypothetical protein
MQKWLNIECNSTGWRQRAGGEVVDAGARFLGADCLRAIRAEWLATQKLEEEYRRILYGGAGWGRMGSGTRLPKLPYRGDKQ